MTTFRSMYTTALRRVVWTGWSHPSHRGLVNHSAPLRCLPLMLILSGLGGSLIGCSGDTVAPPGIQNRQSFWAVQLNWHAVNLALIQPYDTVRLTATPLTVAGTALPGGGAVHFQVVGSDSSLKVDSTGLVTARYTTPGARVIASLTMRGVTLSDTAHIQVTQTPLSPGLKTFSMQPVGGDSAKREFGPYSNANAQSFTYPGQVNVTDSTDHTVCNQGGCPLEVYYSSSNPSVVKIDSMGYAHALYPGHAFLTATTLAYGVAWRDSVEFVTGYSLYAENDIVTPTLPGGERAVFNQPRALILGVGATMAFHTMESGTPVNVVFDNPAAVDSDPLAGDTSSEYFDGVPDSAAGNVPAFGGVYYPDICLAFFGSTSYAAGCDPTFLYATNANFRFRKFSTAGVFHYYSTVVPSDTMTLIIRANPPS